MKVAHPAGIMRQTDCCSQAKASAQAGSQPVHQLTWKHVTVNSEASRPHVPLKYPTNSANTHVVSCSTPAHNSQSAHVEAHDREKRGVPPPCAVQNARLALAARLALHQRCAHAFVGRQVAQPARRSAVRTGISQQMQPDLHASSAVSHKKPGGSACAGSMGGLRSGAAWTCRLAGPWGSAAATAA